MRRLLAWFFCPSRCSMQLEIIERSLFLLHRKVDRMDTRISQLIADFDAETTAIATRIDTLIANSTSVDEIVAGLTPISDRLKTLGSDTSNPIPPVV